MRVLVIGGSNFVGRHIVEALVAAGHAPVLFNRGKTDASLFPQLETIRGDRTVAADVARLRDVAADVVIDTSGYAPDDVRASALAVASHVRRYVFVSSIDACDLGGESVDETTPTKTLPPDAQTATPDPELYGAHKARCERDLVALLGESRVIVARPGLVVGPYDSTDRFTYWPVRVARGGEVLAPRAPSLPVQVIDARDLAAWVVGAIERDLAGTYLLAGDPRTYAIADVLDASRRASGSDARFTYVSDAYLEANAVAAWTELPLWMPMLPEYRGLLNAQNAKARATGLRLRPLEETIVDLLAEVRARPPERGLRAGLSAAREMELLRGWAERGASPHEA